MRTYWTLFVVAMVVVAFMRSSPAQLGFWIAVALALVIASPYFGVWPLRFMAIRALTFMFAVPLLFAAVVADPGSGRFWVVFVSVLVVSVPSALVTLMFLRDAEQAGHRAVSPPR